MLRKLTLVSVLSVLSTSPATAGPRARIARPAPPSARRRPRGRGYRALSVPLVLLVALVTPAVEAGTVRVDGTAVVFDARAGEVNRVVLRPGEQVTDPRTGEVVVGVEVRDEGAPLTLGSGCRAFFGRFLCDVQPSLLVVRLGDRGDTVRQETPLGQVVAPMSVKGGPGDDVITGSALNDLLEGGAGNDVIDGGNGNDTLLGGFGNDRLTGGFGNDRLLGYFGDDQLDGGQGDDELRGQGGSDRLLGAAGADRLFGGPGPDTLLADDDVAETVDCGAGNDTADLDARDTPLSCETRQ